MPRRNRFKRPLMYAVGSIVLVGAVAGGYKQFGHAARQEAVAQPATQPALTPEITPATQPTAKRAAKSAEKLAKNAAADKAAVEKAAGGKSAVFMMDVPSTRPSLALASRPAPTTPVDAPSLFKEADAKIAADDLLAARDALVAALDARKFSDTEREAAYERLSKINEAVVFSPRKFVSDPHQSAYTVVAGDNLQKIANKFDLTTGFLGRVNNISDPRKLRLGANLKIIKGPFHAVVDKTAFTLDLYQGDPNQPGSIFVKRLRVGLGEHDSTPTGLWKIGTKLMNPTYYNSRDTGPRIIPANDPTNPLGERWLALEGISGQAAGKESYGIHGTIDPASIGQKKSMGCVRLLNEDVNLVYDMLIKDKSTVTVVE